MIQDAEISIFKCLDFIRDNAPAYAKAKAQRIFLEEWRKSKKAICMKAAESKGFAAIGAQEREAYADPDYQQVLEALRAAIEEEESLRWLLVGAQAKIEVWRSTEASNRMMDRGAR